MTYYRLNPDNRIVDVGQDWNEFAQNNDGEKAVADSVLGHRFEKFIADTDTKAYMNAIFFVCRNMQAPFLTHYRCDAPHEKRLYEMGIDCDENGVLKVSHKLISKKSINKKVSRSAAYVKWEYHCSICAKYKISNVWLDGIHHNDNDAFAKKHCICPECKSHASSILDKMRVHLYTPCSDHSTVRYFSRATT